MKSGVDFLYIPRKFCIIDASAAVQRREPRAPDAERNAEINIDGYPQ
jgi:hypothetical protein